MGVFKFKRFSVNDDRAAMKVGTDAVLLGAWADVSCAKNLLDIGSGSGVIALMMAQRSAEDSRIDAVELQPEDAQQAAENVSLSPWPHKISVFNSSIQGFNPVNKYDCILCNPPYFSNSLRPQLESRHGARHETTLTHYGLLEASVRLLTPEGRLNIILSHPESEGFISKAIELKLFLSRHTRFFTRHEKGQERSLLEFRFTGENLQEDTLVLYECQDQWTNAYFRLTEDFYLSR